MFFVFSFTYLTNIYFSIHGQSFHIVHRYNQPGNCNRQIRFPINKRKIADIKIYSILVSKFGTSLAILVKEYKSIISIPVSNCYYFIGPEKMKDKKNNDKKNHFGGIRTEKKTWLQKKHFIQRRQRFCQAVALWKWEILKSIQALFLVFIVTIINTI